MQHRLMGLWILLFGGIALLSFPLHHWTEVLYLPLLFAFWVCLSYDPQVAIRVILAWVPFEGIFKVLTSYELIMRFSLDLMILLVLIRMILMDRGQTLLRTFFEAPIRIIFFLHIGWILVQILNPYGLGLLPGLASYKVYVSSLILYFIAYSFSENDRRQCLMDLSWICCGIVLLQVLFTLHQWSGGEAALAAWSPNYKGLLGARFSGIYFRPFGTAHVPGGGSTFVYLAFPVLIGLALEVRKYYAKILISLLLASSTSVLLLSQIRSAVIKALFGSAVIVVILALKRPAMSVKLLLILGALGGGFQYFYSSEDPRLTVARERFETITNARKIYSKRTAGVFDHTMMLVREAPFGIGLSRVGASSAPFIEDIRADTKWGPEWSFADNLYRALLIEVGIPGLILFTLMVFVPVGTILYRIFKDPEIGKRSGDFLIYGAVALAMASIMGHWGSEGLLYQPESTFFWLFLGLALRASETKNIQTR